MKNRVVVVGGGVVGAFTALQAAKAGFSVTLLEAQTLGAGATLASSGLISSQAILPFAYPGILSRLTQHCLGKRIPGFAFQPSLNPRWLRFAWQFLQASRRAPAMKTVYLRSLMHQLAYERWQAFFAQTGQALDGRLSGQLYVYRTPEAFDKACAQQAALSRFDIPYQPLTPQQTAHYLKTASPLVQGGGLYFPNSGHLRPERLMDVLAHQMQQYGVRVLEKMTMRDMEIEGSRAVAVKVGKGDSLPCDHVVLTTGVDFVNTNPLGIRLCLQPGKGYALSYPKPSGLPDIPILFKEDNVVVVPFRQTIRIGSTLRFQGFDREVREKEVAYMTSVANQYLGERFTGLPSDTKVGLRPMRPNDLPIVRRAPTTENVILNIGHGMYGLTQSPICADWVVALLLGRPMRVAHSLEVALSKIP